MERKINNILKHPEGVRARPEPGGRAPAETGATAEAGAAVTGPTVAARLALLFILLLTGTAVSSVAGFGASIRGEVRDEAGNALAGVRIRLIHTGKGTIRQTLTDEKGRFLFGNLFFEAHDLTAELDGYRPFSRSGLVPKADDAVRLDIVMRPDDGGEGGTVLPGVARGHGKGGSGPARPQPEPRAFRISCVVSAFLSDRSVVEGLTFPAAQCFNLRPQCPVGSASLRPRVNPPAGR